MRIVCLAVSLIGILATSLACGTGGSRIEVTLVNDSLMETHMWAFDEEMARSNRLGFGEARTAVGSVESFSLEAVPVFVGRNGATLEEAFCTFDIFCDIDAAPEYSAVANYSGGRFECVETSTCRGGEEDF